MTRKTMIITVVGAVALMACIAGAAAMIYADGAAGKDSAPQAETIRWNDRADAARPPVTHAQAQPVCDDDNIVGKVAGGVAGGVIGSQIGSGSGKTAATIGGSVGGTLLGEEYIPTRNVTCR